MCSESFFICLYRYRNVYADYQRIRPEFALYCLTTVTRLANDIYSTGDITAMPTARYKQRAANHVVISNKSFGQIS